MRTISRSRSGERPNDAEVEVEYLAYDVQFCVIDHCHSATPRERRKAAERGIRFAFDAMGRTNGTVILRGVSSSSAQLNTARVEAAGALAAWGLFDFQPPAHKQAALEAATRANRENDPDLARVYGVALDFALALLPAFDAWSAVTDKIHDLLFGDRKIWECADELQIITEQETANMLLAHAQTAVEQATGARTQLMPNMEPWTAKMQEALFAGTKLTADLSLEEFKKLQVPALRHDAQMLDAWIEGRARDVDIRATAERLLRLHEMIEEQDWLTRSGNMLRGLEELEQRLADDPPADQLSEASGHLVSLALLTKRLVAMTRYILGDDPGPEPHGGPLAAQMALGAKKRA